MNRIVSLLMMIAATGCHCATSAPAQEKNHMHTINGFASSVDPSRPEIVAGESMPDFNEATGWLNSAPLNRKSLRGKVVLVNFWTYTCINSLRPLPYLKSWATEYGDAGLVVIGVHTPEFSFEHQHANVAAATRDLKIDFPIAIDSNYGIWQEFDNHYWPAQYLIDAQGRVRYHHFGEGDYDEIEAAIQGLLRESGRTLPHAGALTLSATGVEAAPDFNHEGSPETYIGYRQAERFASPGRAAHDSPKIYSAPASPGLNQWGLSGSWNVGAESAVLVEPSGRIHFRFHSRDLHMVLSPGKDGKPVRFRVRLDGAEPGSDSGSDIDADGAGVVREPRLYQLVRQKGRVQDRIFEIEFLDPGVQAFAFTFG